MPAQRVSKGFKDVSMSFKYNPLSGDLITLSNENAIARAVRNIVSTTPGEKFFDPDFGSSVGEILFENVDDITAVSIQDEIKSCLGNYEPRVELIDVFVDPNFDENQFDVKITYRIVGVDIPPTQLEFALLPSR
jgi:phage baseplate assembly protein W|tara:strand:- start:487 stop:888 length:402 start_codon:yes stop_codon:yes gene_type:complete